MINLLKRKLDAVDNLKNFTREIMLLSAKTDDKKISSMIAVRQKDIDDINLIDVEIDEYLKFNKDSYIETDDIKTIKTNIRESVKEIISMDKEIRKNINVELKEVKDKLNQPQQKSRLINMRI